jgi:hypothetical protein
VSVRRQSVKDQRAARALPGSTYQSSFCWSNESTDFWVYSLLLTCSVGALLALWFMWDVTHRNGEKPLYELEAAILKVSGQI